MKNWGELSQADKLDIMRMAVSQGITDLTAIKEVYNEFAEGGYAEVNKNDEPQTFAGSIAKATGASPRTVRSADNVSSVIQLTPVGLSVAALDLGRDVNRWYHGENGARKDVGFDILSMLPFINKPGLKKTGTGFMNKIKDSNLRPILNSISSAGVVGDFIDDTSGSDKTSDAVDFIGPILDGVNKNIRSSGGKIHIKPENRGKFTALKKRTGHSASWFKAHGTPAQRKMATFALNARKWKHEDGGLLKQDNIYGLGDKLKRVWAGLTYPDNANDSPEFKDAFRAARNNNDEYFKWNGELYNTRLQPTVYEKQPLELESVRKPQLDSMEDTWNYIRSQNISARNAAALMGNIMQESSFSPVAVQKGGDNAVGLYQLHGGRLADYNKYLKETKKKDNSHSQTDYMLSLINGERGDAYIEEYKRVKNDLDSLKRANKTKEYNETLEYFNKMYKKREEENRLYPISDLTAAWKNENISLEDLTDLFTNTIERAGRPEYEKRQNYAKQFYNHFYGVPKIAR